MSSGRVLEELRRTLERPTRLLNPFRAEWRDARRIRRATKGPAWQDGEVRPYATYEAYVVHQRSKIGVMDLEDYDRDFRVTLSERLGRLPIGNLQGTSVLCLAARLGTEVRAFHDHKAFAVGIDLEPGPDNRLVLPGDFHDLQWPTDSVELVYTNSLDHAFDLTAVVTEIRRVLQPGGRVLIEVGKSEEEGGAGFGRWEARRWDRARHVADEFIERGFSLVHEEQFDEPWPGVGYLLVMESAGVV